MIENTCTADTYLVRHQGCDHEFHACQSVILQTTKDQPCPICEPTFSWTLLDIYRVEIWHEDINDNDIVMLLCPGCHEEIHKDPEAAPAVLEGVAE